MVVIQGYEDPLFHSLGAHSGYEGLAEVIPRQTGPLLPQPGDPEERGSVCHLSAPGFALLPLHTFEGPLNPLTGLGRPPPELSLSNQKSSELCLDSHWPVPDLASPAE